MKRHVQKILYVTFLGALLYTYGSILGGCSPSALSLSAAAAKATRQLNATAAPLIETGCVAKADAAVDNPAVTAEQAAADAQDVADTCHAIEEAQHTFAESLDLWVDLLLKSVVDGEYDDQALLRIAVDTIRLYRTVIPLAARLDFELPDVPDVVLSFIGGQ